MLILDTRKSAKAVRALLPLECWILQGKPMEDWQHLRNQLNVPARRCGQLCGEGIPTSLASAVAQRAFSRVQQARQHLAKLNRPSRKDLHDRPPARDDHHKRQRDEDPGTPPPSNRRVTFKRSDDNDGQPVIKQPRPQGQQKKPGHRTGVSRLPPSEVQTRTRAHGSTGVNRLPPARDHSLVGAQLQDASAGVATHLPITRSTSPVINPNHISEYHRHGGKASSMLGATPLLQTNRNDVVNQVSKSLDTLTQTRGPDGTAMLGIAGPRPLVCRDHGPTLAVNGVTRTTKKPHREHKKVTNGIGLIRDISLTPSSNARVASPVQQQVSPSHQRRILLQPLQQEPTSSTAVLLALDGRSDGLTSLLLYHHKHSWWFPLPADIKEKDARGAATKAMFDQVKRSWPFATTESLTYAITISRGSHNLHVVTLLSSKPPPEWYPVPCSSLPSNSWIDEATLASRAKLISFGFPMQTDHSPTMQALCKAGNISFTKLHANRLKIEELHQVGAMPESSSSLLASFVKDQQKLKEALLAIPVTDPDAHMLHTWAAQIPNQPHPEITQFCEACKYCPIPTSDFHGTTPFTPAYEAPVTEWLHRPRKQRQPPDGFMPKSINDLLLPEGLSLLRQLQGQSLKNHAYLKKGQRPPRTEDTPIIIGEDMVKPEARGIVWDLRPVLSPTGSMVQTARPLDLTAPMTTHLNTELLKTELKEFPDQEVLSMLVEGAQLKAEIPYQVAILPHLSSLTYGYDSVQEELHKMKERDWYEFHDDIPFLPWRALPQGSTSRKYEPDRHRRTTDGGAPRNLIQDSEGREVTPINVACHGGTGVTPIRHSSFWPKEIKPGLLQLMSDINVATQAAGQVFMEAVYSGTDDIFSFFNQIKLAPSELWKTGLHWDSLTAGKSPVGTHVVEKVLGFGLSPNSNIAQRFANAIVYMFTKRFDKVEAPFFEMESDPARRRWIDARKAMGPHQCRLYIIKMYTDDVKFVVVGAERLIRFLRCWDSLMKDMGLIMAIAKKRQLGCASTWLGFLPCPMMSLIAIPREKVSTALTGLTTLAEGMPLRMDAYRSLLGFLEHLIPFDNSGRSSMFGFYNIFKGGQEPSPSAMVKPTSIVQTQSRRKIKILTEHPFVSTLQLALQDASNLLQTQIQAVAYVYTDAAKDDCFNPSIAGYLYGRWWSIPVNAKLHKLPIAALEFLAIVISFIIFYKYLKPYPAVVFSTDSQVSAMVMAADNARSRITQNMQLLLRSLNEYKDLSMRTYVSTVHGVGNIMGDGYSRSKHKAMKAVTAELGVRTHRMKITPRVWAITNMDFEDPELMIGMAADDNGSCGIQALAQAFDLPMEQVVAVWRNHIDLHLSKPSLPNSLQPHDDPSSGDYQRRWLTHHLQVAYSVYLADARSNVHMVDEPDLSRPQHLRQYIDLLAEDQAVMPMSWSLMVHLYNLLNKYHGEREMTLSIEHHTPGGVVLATSHLCPRTNTGALRGSTGNTPTRHHLVLARCHWMTMQEYCRLNSANGLPMPKEYVYTGSPAEMREAHELPSVLLTRKPPPAHLPTMHSSRCTALEIMATMFDIPVVEVKAMWMEKLEELLSPNCPEADSAVLVKQVYQEYLDAMAGPSTKGWVNLNNRKHLLSYVKLLMHTDHLAMPPALMKILYATMAANRCAPRVVLIMADDKGLLTFSSGVLPREEQPYNHPRLQLTFFITFTKGQWSSLSDFTLRHRRQFMMDGQVSLCEHLPPPEDATQDRAHICTTIRIMSQWFQQEGCHPPKPQFMCGLTGVAGLLQLSEREVTAWYSDMLQHSSTIFGGSSHISTCMLDAWAVMLITRAQALRQQKGANSGLERYATAVDMAASNNDRRFMQDWPNATLPSSTFMQLPPYQRASVVAKVANKLKVCLAQEIQPISSPLLRYLLLFIASEKGIPPLRIKQVRFRSDSSPRGNGLFSNLLNPVGCMQLQVSQEVLPANDDDGSPGRMRELGTLTLLNHHWMVNTPQDKFFHEMYDSWDIVPEPLGDTMWLGMGTIIPQQTLTPNESSNSQLPHDCGAKILALCFLLDRRVLLEEWVDLIDEAFSEPSVDALTNLMRHTHLTMEGPPPLPAYIQEVLYAAFEAYHLAMGRNSWHTCVWGAPRWQAPQGRGWEAYYKRMAWRGIIPLSPILMSLLYDRLRTRWHGSNMVIIWPSPTQQGVHQTLHKEPKWPHPFETAPLYAMLADHHWLHGPSAALATMSAVQQLQPCGELLDSAFMVGMGDHPQPRTETIYYVPRNCGVRVLALAFDTNVSAILATWHQLIHAAFDHADQADEMMQVHPLLQAGEPCIGEPPHENHLQRLLFAAFVGYHNAVQHGHRGQDGDLNTIIPFLTAHRNEGLKAFYSTMACDNMVPLSPNLMVILYRLMSTYLEGRPLILMWDDPHLDDAVQCLPLDFQSALRPYGSAMATHGGEGQLDPVYALLFRDHWFHSPEVWDTPVARSIANDAVSFSSNFNLRQLAYTVGMGPSTTSPSKLPTEESPTANDKTDPTSTAREACGLLLIASVMGVPYDTAHDIWCHLLGTLRTAQRHSSVNQAMSVLRPLLYDAYSTYESRDNLQTDRLEHMARLGLHAEMLYYHRMSQNHIVPLSPPLMRWLYGFLLRFRPHVELVIMWETVHIKDSHHDICYVTVAPRNPFAQVTKEYIILSRGHWWKWNVFNAAHIEGHINWLKPCISSASTRIGLGKRGRETPNRQPHACGVSPRFCVTPPYYNVVASMPTKEVPPNAQQCVVCDKWTHYHCGILLSKAEQGLQPRPPAEETQAPSRDFPTPRQGPGDWFCLDCVDSHSHKWNFVPLVQRGLPPFGQAAAGPTAISLSNGRHTGGSMAVPGSSLLPLGSGVLAIARALSVDSEDVLAFLNPNGAYQDTLLDFRLPLAVALPTVLAQSLELLKLAMSGDMVDHHQRSLPQTWKDLQPQVQRALDAANKVALATRDNELMTLPSHEAYSMMATQGLCPMSVYMLTTITRAVGVADNRRLRLRSQVMDEGGHPVWRLLIADRTPERLKRVGIITLRGFTFDGYPAPMCCGDQCWTSMDGIQARGSSSSPHALIALGAIGLGTRASDLACGLHALATAMATTYNTLYGLYHAILRSQLSNLNVNLQACLDVAHLAYYMHADNTGASVHFFQSILESGINKTLAHMMALANEHVVPLSPPLMRFLYEAYCERVPGCNVSLCLIWKCNNNYVAWNYLHPPSPLLAYKRQYIMLCDYHWHHLSEYEVSIKLPPCPEWFVPNIVLYDELVGAALLTEPLFWVIASEIGTGKGQQRTAAAGRSQTLAEPQPPSTAARGTHDNYRVNPQVAAELHSSGLACPIEALASAFQEPFGRVLTAWMEFLAQLRCRLDLEIYEYLVSVLAVFHDDISKDMELKAEFYSSLKLGSHAVICHATRLAEDQIVPMSPPLVAVFYQHLIMSPTLGHLSDTEVCLLWQAMDDTMARVIIHPAHPFQALPRTFIVLCQGHYTHVPVEDIGIVLPDCLRWSSPRLEELTEVVGLGCFGQCLGFRPTATDRTMEMLPAFPEETSPEPTPVASPCQQQQHRPRQLLPGVSSSVGTLKLHQDPNNTGGRMGHTTSQAKQPMLSTTWRNDRPFSRLPSAKYDVPTPKVSTPPLFESPRPEMARSQYSINNATAAATINDNISSLVAKSPSILTTKMEESHWRYWCTYTNYLQTSSIRDNAAANSGMDASAHQTEISILKFAPIWIAQNCMEGRKGTGALGQSITRPTPQSALQVMSSVSRIHRRKGITMATVSWKDVFDGMCREYVQDYGVSALQPQHHETFTREEINRLTSPPDGLIVTNTMTVGDNIKWRSFHGAECTSSETGERIADWALNRDVPFTLNRMTRSSITWIIQGRHHDNPDMALLSSVGPGDMAVLTSASSKNDKFGLNWAGTPRYLPFGPHNNCACASLAAYELIHPCPLPLRNQVPLFSTDRTHTPWSTHDMANSLRCLQQRLDLPTRTWHSFRVYVASALLASGQDDATIQAMCHWKTQEASRLYSRMDPVDFAKILLKASTADVSSVQARNLPDIDLANQLQALTVASPKPASTMKARLQQTKRHRHGKGSNRTKMIRARPMVNKVARTRKGHIRDNVWEVESIVKSRKSSHGSREVLIKWKGWPHSANSWEPSTNMVD